MSPGPRHHIGRSLLRGQDIQTPDREVLPHGGGRSGSLSPDWVISGNFHDWSSCPKKPSSQIDQKRGGCSEQGDVPISGPNWMLVQTRQTIFSASCGMGIRASATLVLSADQVHHQILGRNQICPLSGGREPTSVFRKSNRPHMLRQNQFSKGKLSASVHIVVAIKVVRTPIKWRTLSRLSSRN